MSKNALIVLKYMLMIIWIFFVSIYAIDEIVLIMKSNSYESVTGTIQSISNVNRYDNSQNSRKTVRYIYNVNSKNYESFNLYTLSLFSNVKEGDSCIVFYEQNYPENSFTSFEKSDLTLQTIIKISVVTVIFIGAMVWLRKIKIN